jgi:uncharacterized protein with HEPN domain
VRDDEARVVDITEACGQILQFVSNDRERFRTDPVVQAAAQRWLEIIGEASARLSDDFKLAHPAIRWRDLVGMRNILAHGYFHIDEDILWAAITVDVPRLLAGLQPAQEGD